MKLGVFGGVCCFFLTYFYYFAPHSERNYQNLSAKLEILQKELNLLETKKNILQNRMLEALVSTKDLNQTKKLLLSERNITSQNEILIEITPPTTLIKSTWKWWKITLILLSFLLGMIVVWKEYWRKILFWWQKKESLYLLASSSKKPSLEGISRDNSLPE